MDRKFERTLKYKAEQVKYMNPDDIPEPSPSRYRPNLIETDYEAPQEERKGKNIAELLLGDDDIKGFARKYNLDPDMSE